MAIAYVGSTPALTTTAASSLANARSLTAGNLVIVVAGTNTSGGFTTHSLGDSRGNTIPATTTSTTTSNSRLSVWVIPNCLGGAGSFTLTAGGSSNINLDVYEYSGAALSSVLDGTPDVAAGDTGGTGNLNLASITTTQDGSLLFISSYVQDVSTTFTASGYTSRLNSVNTATKTSAGLDIIATTAGSQAGVTVVIGDFTTGAHAARMGIKAATGGGVSAKLLTMLSNQGGF